MRRYRILISDPMTGKEILDYDSTNPDGSDNLNALDVTFDIPVTWFHAPMGNGFARVMGIPLSVINQGVDLFQKTIAVYGGMSKSYPLNNPGQYGLLMKGYILQSFGNWIGIDQTLDCIANNKVGSETAPLNIVVSWPKGMTMQTALTNSIKVAIPGVTVSGNISNLLVQDHDEHGIYESFQQLAKWAFDKSRKIIAAYYASLSKPDNYPGVGMIYIDDQVLLIDISSGAPKNIEFTDLIGQPTWIEPQTMQMTCVMRSDLKVGDLITMPKSQVTTTSNSYSFARQSSIFSGTMRVQQVRHVGSFRNPDARSWATVINAAFTSL